MFIEEISDKPENELADKFDRLTKELSHACEEAMDLLTDGIDKADENALIDIVANIKGSKKALYKLAIKYSDIPTETLKKIDEKSDNFLAGLGISDEKPAKKETEDKEEKEEPVEIEVKEK